MGKEHQTHQSALRAGMVLGRRAKVAELLCRGYTQYAIYEEMAASGEHINRYTGNPWSYATIQEDTRAVRTQWQEEAKLHYDIHVSRLLGQIREVRKTAWSQEDLGMVLKTLDREVKLLGLDKATKTDIDWKESLRNAGIDPAETFDDLVQTTFKRLVLAGEIEEQGA